MTKSRADEHLPLRPVIFGILSVLRAGPLHGYGIMQQANEHVGERALLGPSTCRSPHLLQQRAVALTSSSVP